MNAETLTRALDGHSYGNYRQARCPAHDDRNPSLSISDGDDGVLLVHCHAGCEQAAVIDALKARGLWDGWASESVRARRRTGLGRNEDTKPASVDDDRRTEAARALWCKALPLPGTPAHAYLRSRAITIEAPPSLRYLAAAKHTPTNLILPALIAGMVRWPSRHVVAIQRTFLRADGADKAPVSHPRMTLGPARGGAVRLAPAGSRLALCEGVEDALSVMQATGIPAWACLGTSGLRAVVLPPLPSASTVTIFADGDEAGERAARELAKRLAGEGRRVSIARPPLGKDFNDTLCAAARSTA